MQYGISFPIYQQSSYILTVHCIPGVEIVLKQKKSKFLDCKAELQNQVDTSLFLNVRTNALEALSYYSTLGNCLPRRFKRKKTEQTTKKTHKKHHKTPKPKQTKEHNKRGPSKSRPMNATTFIYCVSLRNVKAVQ